MDSILKLFGLYYFEEVSYDDEKLEWLDENNIDHTQLIVMFSLMFYWKYEAIERRISGIHIKGKDEAALFKLRWS